MEQQGRAIAARSSGMEYNKNFKKVRTADLI